MTAIARTVARGELERAERARAESGARDSIDAGPFAGVRTVGELMTRGFSAQKGDPILNWGAAIARRAIANQVIADSPGVHSGGVSGTIRGIVNPSRPVVNAFGTDDPGGSGLTAYWPYITVDIETLVAVQSAEKAEITSVKVPILRGSAVLATYAGGSDISYQNIKRSDPSYIEAYTRIMLSAWAAVTDKAFATAILAAAGSTLPTVAVGATDAEHPGGHLRGQRARGEGDGLARRVRARGVERVHLLRRQAPHGPHRGRVGHRRPRPP